jgi:hypothetical protein
MMQSTGSGFGSFDLPMKFSSVCDGVIMATLPAVQVRAVWSVSFCRRLFTRVTHVPDALRCLPYASAVIDLHCDCRHAKDSAGAIQIEGKFQHLLLYIQFGRERQHRQCRNQQQQRQSNQVGHISHRITSRKRCPSLHADIGKTIPNSWEISGVFMAQEKIMFPAVI